MLVDRRKDNYDELLVLARDARASRRRASRWTTGIVTSAVVATGIYVASMNSQVDQLREAKGMADNNQRTVQIELARMQADYRAALAERDAYKQIADWYAATPDARESMDSPTETTRNIFEAPDSAGRGQAVIDETVAFIWYVDGSKRFPMAVGDILWIPEARFWVRLEGPGEISVHTPLQNRPPSPDDEGTPGEVDRDNNYFEASGSREALNCVRIHLDSRTLRPTFGADYYDMIVDWRNDPNCGEGFGSTND